MCEPKVSKSKQNLTFICLSRICLRQVITFTATVITTFLMITACANTEWIVTGTWGTRYDDELMKDVPDFKMWFREGLFEQCIKEGCSKPVPFTAESEEDTLVPTCRRAHSAGELVTSGHTFVTNWLFPRQATCKEARR